MKKSSSKIRGDIIRLQEELKLAETREAQRIGRIALKAGLGELDITEDDLFAAFEDLAARFHGKADGDRSDRNVKQSSSSQRTAPEAVETGAAADGDPEA